MEVVITTAPPLNLTLEDLPVVLGELAAYHQIDSPLFQRREQRENAELSLRGLLSPLTRKSIEPIVLQLVGVDRNAVRSLQCFVSLSGWDDTELLPQHWGEVDHDLGEADGVLTVDGSDFPKPGKASVGVKRQYGGQWGKRANCQAGVFVGYASRKGYTLLHRRLYLPEAWLTEEAFAARRTACGIPAETTLQTKPEVALTLMQAVVQPGTLRCRWVTADEAFGRDTAFLDGVADCGLWYCAEVPHDTRVWLERPGTVVPQWRGHGRKPTQPQVVAEAPRPHTVAAVAAQLPPAAWQSHLSKEGSQGPLLADCTCLRVVAVRHSLPGPDVWLLLRRHPETGARKTYLANAPADTTVETLVRVSGMRWPIATCFEDSKQWLGMGDDAVRSWTGWHHHMTLVTLAHFFVVRTMLAMKKKPRP
jgi:SRSO17 transposase